MKAAKENNVELSKSNEKAWQLHERDVVDGMQKFLDSGDIVVDGKALEKNACRAEKAGGNVHSDVKVVNLGNRKTFYVECKLDFKTSRYFKY